MATTATTDARERARLRDKSLGLGTGTRPGGPFPRRGPNGNGTTAATGLPTAWSLDKNIVWKTALPGPGTSSPVTTGNRIFLTCYTGYALDPNSPGVQQLKSSAVPLVLSFSEEQKNEVRQLARLMGLEQVASSF